MTGRIRRRSKSSWEICVDIGRDQHGKRLRKYVNVKGRKADAERRLRELVSAMDSGAPIDEHKGTLSEFMRRWLEDQVKTTTRPKTQVSYEALTRLHIEPQVGHLPLSKLSPSDVQRVVAGVLDKGLSQATARRAYSVLHGALTCALRWGLITRNVCDAVDPPFEAEHELSPPDIATVRALLEEAMSTAYGPAFHLGAYTSMRRGEIAGLLWDRVSLDNGTVSVVAALSRESGKLELVPLKSEGSRRMIHIDTTTVKVLRSHRAQQAEHRLSLGSLYSDQGYVFASQTGDPMDPDSYTKAWDRVCQKVGVKYRLHDLRHHHITYLLELGVNIKEVQERAGHSSPAFTLSRYAHVTPGTDRAASEVYERAMSE